MSRSGLAALTTAGLAAFALSGVPPAFGHRLAGDPGRLTQTQTLPSAATPRFRARMAALFQGILEDSLPSAKPAFFPLSAYLQVKQIADPAGDYRNRLLANFRADIHAAHLLVARGGASATFVGVRVPREWSWITPGYCANRVGYWHAPGSRLVYRQGGRLRSFGVFSLISWRGEWYVVHLAAWDRPGTVDDPAPGIGIFGPPGGC
jgi:hypothetical protein